MKKYTFTVEIEEYTTGSSFIDSIKSEIRSEKAQLEITHKINRATSKVLKQVLEDFLKPINDELGKVNLGFKDYRDDISSSSNNCTDHYFILKLPRSGWSYVIGIFGISDRNFNDSKYITYTGDYNIMLGLNACLSYTSCQKDKLSTVKNAEEVYERIRDKVKAEILEQ